jgi:hypothetical protein
MKRLGSGVLLAIVAACGGSSQSSSAPAAPEPAPAPVVAGATCEGVVAKMMAMSGDEMFGQVPADKQAKWKGRFSDLMITACREDGWPQAALDCADAAPDEAAFDACGDRIGTAEEEKMRARMQPFMQELTAEVGGEPPVSAQPEEPSYDLEAAAAWTSGPTSVAACDGYLAVVDGYQACDKVPPAAIEATRSAVALMTEAWAALRRPDGPVEARRAAAAGCMASVGALQHSMAALDCAPVTPPPPALIAAPAADVKAKKAKAKVKAKKAEKAD